MLRGFFFFEADLEDRAEVYADPGLLEVVWTNLLSNAVKFTPEGGTVTLHQRTEPGRVLVSVEDTGCGMTPETMRHIYDKFYQGDSSHATHGNGLGLALVRRFLEKTDDAPENGAITRTTLIFSLEKLQEKLRAQTAYPNLRGMIASNVRLAQKAAALPLWMKCAAVQAGFEICGGHSSCITVSNLGQAEFPEPIAREITGLDFMLTPRLHSPYNCGIVSAGDTVSLTLTRRGADKGFEKLFVANLLRQGVVPTAEETPD